VNPLLRDDPQSLAGVRTGEVLAGKYRVEGVIGVGGMGAVVEAWHVDLETKVAIKILLPDKLGYPDAVSRFAREAKASARIASDHVVRVHDVGTLPSGAPYYVMEHLEGKDLSVWLSQRGPVSVERAVDFVLQTCLALADAHGLGIVHRDLKPANLFCVQRTDGKPFLKVLDFGISKISELDAPASVTSASTMIGSPCYMSPEQMQSSRDVDKRTDVWALGVIAYELLTGQLPFVGKTLGETLFKVATQQAPSVRELRPDTPEPLAAAIARCLEKDRDARFPDVAQLAAAVEPFGPAGAGLTVERVRGIVDGTGTRPSMTRAAQPAAPTLESRREVSSEPRRSAMRPTAPPSVEIRVKGTVLLSVLQSAREVGGDSLHDAALRGLTGELTECIRSGGPMATTWYPVAWHRELLGVVMRQGGPTVFRDVVRRSTNNNVGRIHRVLVRMMTPDTLISRSSGVFSSYFEGSFSAKALGDGLTRIEWKNCLGFDKNCWTAQTHTVEEMVSMSGAKLLRKTVLSGGEDGDSEMALEVGWK
jgi:serine/threonine-protein kinase